MRRVGDQIKASHRRIRLHVKAPLPEKRVHSILLIGLILVLARRDLLVPA